MTPYLSWDLYLDSTAAVYLLQSKLSASLLSWVGTFYHDCLVLCCLINLSSFFCCVLPMVITLKIPDADDMAVLGGLGWDGAYLKPLK